MCEFLILILKNLTSHGMFSVYGPLSSVLHQTLCSDYLNSQ